MRDDIEITREEERGLIFGFLLALLCLGTAVGLIIYYYNQNR